VDADRRIATIAARQHGLVTRIQATEAGLSRRAIEHRVAIRRWAIVRRGVYLLAGVPRTWEQAALAACLAAGEGTLVAGATGARLWTLRQNGLPRDRIRLLSAADRRVRLAGVTAHRSIFLPACDVARHRLVPVTSTARTIVDASAHLTPRLAGLLLDDADRRGLVTLEAVRACAARLVGPGRRQLGAIREVLIRRLPGWDPGDSDLEVLALTLIRRAGLPMPVQQHAVAFDHEEFEIDLAYPEHLVAIELDGWDFHRLRSDFDRDARKRALLAAHRWHVLPFTTETIHDLPRLLRPLIPVD
jgi:hypothetical protein